MSFPQRVGVDYGLQLSAFIPKSLRDWPGKVAAVVFVPGCNFACGYCFSGALVTSPKSVPKLDWGTFFESLDQNDWEVEGVVITGGEPTLQGESLIDFCEDLQLNGLKVKLETNGSKSGVLKELLEGQLLDFVSLDLKTVLFPKEYDWVTNAPNFTSNVMHSIKLIKRSGVDYEFRTTLIPSVVDGENILALSRQVARGRSFVVQQFQNVPGLVDKKFEQLREPTYDELLSVARKIHGFQEVRIRTEKGDEVVSPAPRMQRIEAKK